MYVLKCDFGRDIGEKLCGLYPVRVSSDGSNVNVNALIEYDPDDLAFSKFFSNAKYIRVHGVGEGFHMTHEASLHTECDSRGESECITYF